MKRLFSLLLCFGLIVCMSAVSFAVALSADSSYKYVEDVAPGMIFSQDSDLTNIGVLATSLLTDEQKDFMREFLVSPDENYNYFISIASSNNIVFYRYPSGVAVMSDINTANQTCFRLSDGTKFNRYSFFLSGSDLILNSSYDVSNPAISRLIYSSESSLYSKLLRDDDRIYYRGANLAFEDDGGLEDSEPPPSSSEPDQETPIDQPDIEYDSQYVHYDLNVWDIVLKAVIPTLKKVFWIMFPIFTIIIAIKIFFEIIKMIVLRFFGKKLGNKQGKITKHQHNHDVFFHFDE